MIGNELPRSNITRNSKHIWKPVRFDETHIEEKSYSQLIHDPDIFSGSASFCCKTQVFKGERTSALFRLFLKQSGKVETA